MKEIKLTQGKFALVDDEDFEYLSLHRWTAVKFKNSFYAQCHIYNENNERKTVLMHRLIMGSISLIIDHIDHNGLNNQRSNLRHCTRSQNAKNRTPYGKSKYLGVWLQGKYISAQIRNGSKTEFLGRFNSQEGAAKAYDEAAKKYHGEFANLNFK